MRGSKRWSDYKALNQEAARSVASAREFRGNTQVNVKRMLILTIAIASTLAGAQSRRLLVLNQEEATLMIIDPQSGKMLRRIRSKRGATHRNRPALAG